MCTQVPDLRRIAVVGTSGAGKTSFARALSQRLQIPHIELDELHWSANWQEVPDELFRDRVSSATSGSAWVSDGNYHMVRDIIWSRADAVIWLDYSFTLVMTRLFMRTMDRIINRTEIWHGNRETWQKQFFHRDSILWWGLSTFARRRREYEEIFEDKPLAQVEFIRFARPEQAEVWLKKLDSN